jgi:lipopolysaccharide transport system permease protein
MKSNRDVLIYTPASALRRLDRLAWEMLRDLLKGRELARRLAIRDVSAQYRQTLLGFLWVFILPLANTLTWVFLNRTGVVSMHETALPYPVYVFTGSMLWAIFIDALNAPLQLSTVAKPMLAKLNFPREALILSGIYQTVFNGSIKMALMFLTFPFFGIHFSWSMLLMPVAFFSLILAGTTTGLLLTPMGLLYSDVGKAIPLMSQFLMFITPAVFPLPQNGKALALFQINPMTPIILTSRQWDTGLPVTHLAPFLIINLSFLGVFVFTWIAFRVTMPILVERMSA